MGSQWFTGILEPAADNCGCSSMDQWRLAPLREAVLFQENSRRKQPGVCGSLVPAERPASLPGIPPIC